MIFYFSATGNSKYVSKCIAEATDNDMIDILKIDDYNFNLKDNESIGFISPTYAWGLPPIMFDFIDKLNFSNYHNNYVYFIATYGTSPGATGNFIGKHLSKRGINVNAYFSVIMPDTWTPTFDLSDFNKNNKTLEKSKEEIKSIIPKIQNRENGDFMDNKKSPMISKIFYTFAYNRGMRKTKNFGVSNECISCGKCEKLCPVNVIKLIDNKPTWVKKKCLVCLRCLHNCPNFAIQYGTNTIKHGQYINPYVKIK